MNDEAQEAIEPTDAPPQEAQPDPYAAEAVEYGWTPPEEWSGDNGNHMSAEKFMTHGPGTSRKLQAQVKTLTAKLDTVATTHEQQLANHSRAITAAAEAKYNAQMRGIQAAQREAAETGDVKRFDALEKQKSSVQQQQAPQAPAPNEADNKAMGDWITANPQYKTDPAFQAETDALWNKAATYGIQEVSKVLEFINDNRPAAPQRIASAVDGGGVGFIPGRAKAKGWREVPEEAKQAAKEFIDDGLFDDEAKELGVSAQEAYAIEYHKGD